MTDERGTEDTNEDAVRDRLAEWLREVAANPRGHDFFAVLRRVEALRDELPRWGRAARPSQEMLRLSQDAELDFAPAALSSLDLEARPVPRLGVRFFGVFGSHGPMPLHFTEYARERLRVHGDPTIVRFVDIFHHRLLSFFYRAWAEAQPTTQLDRPQTERYAAWLGSSFGFHGMKSGSRKLPASAELVQAGLLSSRSRHPEGLRKVLADYFDAPIEIEQNVPQWLALDRDERSRIGHARQRGRRSRTQQAQLGVSAVSGSKVYDRQYKFRVVVGPLSLSRYQAFIPGRTAWSALHEWIDHYAGLDLRWDVRLVLARDALPAPRLGSGVRLGLTTWIGTNRLDRDRGDLRLRPHGSSLTQRRSSHA